MTLTSSTESDLLRSPPDEVVEAPLHKVRFFFYQSQLSLLTLEVPQIK